MDSILGPLADSSSSFLVVFLVLVLVLVPFLFLVLVLVLFLVFFLVLLLVFFLVLFLVFSRVLCFARFLSFFDPKMTPLSFQDCPQNPLGAPFGVLDSFCLDFGLSLGAFGAF